MLHLDDTQIRSVHPPHEHNQWQSVTPEYPDMRPPSRECPVQSMQGTESSRIGSASTPSNARSAGKRSNSAPAAGRAGRSTCSGCCCCRAGRPADWGRRQTPAVHSARRYRDRHRRTAQRCPGAGHACRADWGWCVVDAQPCLARQGDVHIPVRHDLHALERVDGISAAGVGATLAPVFSPARQIVSAGGGPISGRRRRIAAGLLVGLGFGRHRQGERGGGAPRARSRYRMEALPYSAGQVVVGSVSPRLVGVPFNAAPSAA